MLRVFLVLFLGGLLLWSGNGQDNSSPVTPGKSMEGFMTQAGIQVVWSKQVGRVDSDIAHAVITALIARDSSHPDTERRGIRIELSNISGVKDVVYTTEADLEGLLIALNEVSNGFPRWLARTTSRGQTRCWGSQTFARGHGFHAAVCQFEDAAVGTKVTTGGAVPFRFNGVYPSAFATAILAARDELKRQ